MPSPFFMQDFLFAWPSDFPAQTGRDLFSASKLCRLQDHNIVNTSFTDTLSELVTFRLNISSSLIDFDKKHMINLNPTAPTGLLLVPIVQNSVFSILVFTPTWTNSRSFELGSVLYRCF